MMTLTTSVTQMINDCIQFGRFFEKNNFGQRASFMDKKPDHIQKNGLDFVSKNEASSILRIIILKFSLDFLSRNDASSNPRNWIFCPKFANRGQFQFSLTKTERTCFEGCRDL